MKPELPLQVITGNKDHDGCYLDVVPDKWVNFKGLNVFYSSKGFRSYRKAVRQSDSIFFINGIYSLHFNLLPLVRFKGRKIISTRGMLFSEALNQKIVKKKLFLLALKFFGLHKKCEYHATSEQEKKCIQEVFGKGRKIWVIPNLPHFLNYQVVPSKKSGSVVMCTIGLIGPMKNLLCILRAIKESLLNITYHIYGPITDNHYWILCRQEIDAMPPNITVTYHGGIKPERIPYALSESHIYIQPSKSENFGHSIFEALTAGKPVITSHNTPWNELERYEAGFNVNPDNAMQIHDTIKQFTQMGYAELELWSKNARDYAIDYMDVDKVKKEYLTMFRNNQ